MARPIHKLTPGNAERKSKRPGLYGDGGGLYLRVTPPSASSWVFRYMISGAAREMGIGSYPGISLELAREMAREARKLKALGVDPIDARDFQRASQRLQTAKTLTFRQCADAYMATHRESWKSKHASQWGASLEAYAMPVFGDVPVAAVDRTLVIQALEPIWKTKTETASRVRGRIESVLDWAGARGYREGDNPARWKGHLKNIFPARSKARAVQHLAALPYRELAAVMEKLRADHGLGSTALQLTILTAARTNEIFAAQWPEFDLANAVWTVPASRKKMKREHRVPLSKPAMALLRKLHELSPGEGYVLPGRRPNRHLSHDSMLITLERIGRDDITVHGFRSTFRDWVEETTNFAGSVAEGALAHIAGDKVEAAYRRGDLFEKRRKLMAAWATFCMTPAESAKVIPIGSKR